MTRISLTKEIPYFVIAIVFSMVSINLYIHPTHDVYP
jgi:hypothetical protein